MHLVLSCAHLVTYVHLLSVKMQPDALAMGKPESALRREGCREDLIPHRTFEGNRPSLSLLVPKVCVYPCCIVDMWHGTLFGLSLKSTIFVSACCTCKSRCPYSRCVGFFVAACALGILVPVFDSRLEGQYLFLVLHPVLCTTSFVACHAPYINKKVCTHGIFKILDGIV